MFRKQPILPLEMTYKAFISCGHAADDKVAPALQSGLKAFAKPSQDFLLLASIESRKSLWVVREVATSRGLTLTPRIIQNPA